MPACEELGDWLITTRAGVPFSFVRFTETDQPDCKKPSDVRWEGNCFQGCPESHAESMFAGKEKPRCRSISSSAEGAESKALFPDLLGLSSVAPLSVIVMRARMPYRGVISVSSVMRAFSINLHRPLRLLFLPLWSTRNENRPLCSMVSMGCRTEQPLVTSRVVKSRKRRFIIWQDLDELATLWLSYCSALPQERTRYNCRLQQICRQRTEFRPDGVQFLYQKAADTELYE